MYFQDEADSKKCVSSVEIFFSIFRDVLLLSHISQIKSTLSIWIAEGYILGIILFKLSYLSW